MSITYHRRILQGKSLLERISNLRSTREAYSPFCVGTAAALREHNQTLALLMVHVLTPP